MNPTLIVFKKELRDMFRDKRVRSSAFIMPILLIVGMLYLFGGIIGNLGKPQNQKIHAVKTGNPLLAELKSKGINVIEVPTLEKGLAMVRSGDARVLLQFPDSAGGLSQTVHAYYDKKEQLGQIALRVVKEVYDRVNRQLVGAYLQQHNLPAGAQDLVKVQDEPVQVGEAGGASEMIIGLIPYMIVIWAFYGGLGIAGDLVAGEKEKNTLETLLVAPVGRNQIVVGKFLALAVVCLLSSLSSVVGLGLYALLKPPGSAMMLSGGLGLTPLSMTVTIVALLPTVALFASIMIAISTFARNLRESQTYLSLVSFIVVIPAIFVNLLGLTDLGKQMWINFVPVLNTGANIRAAFLGKADLTALAMTVISSSILAVILLRVAVWLFRREQVLTRI